MAIDKTITPKNFVSYCATLIPTVFDDSLSYYEALCHLVKLVQDNSEITNKYIDELKVLEEYVKTYFDNLDIQSEVNNKLDEMAESGQLAELVASYLDANVAWTFNNIAEMKLASNLTENSFAQTLGYASVNDGGKALYKIRPVTTDDEIDDMFIISLEDNRLIAELVYGQRLIPETIGIAGDGSVDCTTKMQTLVDFVSDKGLGIRGDGIYKISDSITIPNVENIDIVLNEIDATDLTNQPAFILDHTRYGELSVNKIAFTKTSAIDVHGSYSYKAGFLLKGTSYVNVYAKHIQYAQTAFVLHSVGKTATEGCYYNTLKCDKADTFNFMHLYTSDGAINGNIVEKGLHIISEWTNPNSATAYSIINDAHASQGTVYQNNHNDVNNFMIEKYTNDAITYAIADLNDLSNSYITVDRIEVMPSLDINNLVTYNTNSSYNLVKIRSGWFVVSREKALLGNNNYIVSYQNFNKSLNNNLYVDDGGAVLGSTFTAVTNGICDGTITYNPATSRIRINGIFTCSQNMTANTNYNFCTIATTGKTYSHGFVYLAGGGNPTTMTQVGTIRRVKNQNYCYMRLGQNVGSGNYLYVDFECDY